MNIQTLLSNSVAQAMSAAGLTSNHAPVIKQSSKPQFGDYQANGVMSIAKKLAMPPKQLAEQIIAHLELGDMIEKAEIAGPGFINFFLNDNWLIKQGEKNLTDPKLGLSMANPPQTIVVDYSAPNIAKEMHVGHLRSTIIGDAAVRTLEFIGHRVIRANHVGDWGTQFGMLIAYLEKKQHENTTAMQLPDLETFYREAKQQYDSDTAFAEKARHYVVKLQRGEEHCALMWRKLVDLTMAQNIATYKRLNVTLSISDTMGESLYNTLLPGIVADLKEKGLAKEDQGAMVVYLDEFKNKNGEPMGVIVQKSDGGYLYTTTDLACAVYRHQILHADRILYYIDSRQHQHLKQVWSILQKANLLPASLKLEHHMFGMMLGKDGKPFKTRSGDTVKLNDLLDEAEERAEKLIQIKNPDLNENERKAIVNAIAIGAVKYADLSKNRMTDYMFDWDAMLTFEGNTAPYLQYAYTRIFSVFKKAKLVPEQLDGCIMIQDGKERALLVRLLQFDEAVQSIVKDGLPHLLCSYLYDIATLFSSFYEHCPILTVSNSTLQSSRLKLSALTARTLKIGLEMLGINTVEKM